MALRRSRLNATTTSTPTAQAQPRWWKRVVAVLIFPLILGGIGWFLWQPPDEVECITNLNAYCSPDVLEKFAPLHQTPWIRLPNQFAQQREALLESFDEVVDVKLTQRPLRQAEVEIVYAQPLFTASVGDQHWQVLSNAYLKPTDEAPLPLIQFPSEEFLLSLNQDEQNQYAYLVSQLENLTVRSKALAVRSNEEIAAEFVNSGQVLLKIGDHQTVDQQLATLQAFFRSSTIDQDYKVLDLRFAGLAVVKE